MDLTQLTHEQAKKRLLRFYIVAVAGLICFAVSIGCIVAGSVLREQAYQSFIGISPATNNASRSTSYRRAIHLCPDRPDAYLELIKMYGEDGIFRKEESEEFLGIYNANHIELNKRDVKYAELHYTAGYLYISGYESAITTNLRMALPFFERAALSIQNEDPNTLTVDCYCQIGAFYRDYIWDSASAFREVSPEVMISLISRIKATLTAFHSDTSLNSTYNRLGFYTAVCNFLHSERDTLAITVPKETVMEVIDTIYADLPDANTLQKDQTKQMVQILNMNETIYRDAITRAYQRTGG